MWSRAYEWFVRLGGRVVARLKPAGATGAGVLLALLLATPAGGQTLAQQATAQAAGAAGAAQLSLSLDDAVRMGLENNLDLKVDRLDPQIAKERVDQAESVFLPALTSSLLRNSALAPPTSFLVGNQGVQSTTGTGTVGVAQRLPHFGTQLRHGVGYDPQPRRRVSSPTTTRFSRPGSSSPYRSRCSRT